MIPVTSQPFAINAPAVATYQPLPTGEKGCSHVHHQYAQQYQDSEACAHRCRNTRARRVLSVAFLVATSIALFFTTLVLYDMFFNGGAWADALGLTQEGAWNAVGGFVKRQSSDSSSSSSDTFVDHKLYLIIIFVGLFLVVVAGICLSAWCCRSSFENPLCCPCYLCACCGGLACLECIGCGLCAEGVEQM